MTKESDTQSQDSKLGIDKRGRGLWFLSLSALLWSLMPLTIALSEADNNPFLFFAVFGFAEVFGLVAYLLYLNIKHKELGLFKYYISHKNVERDNTKTIIVLSFTGHLGTLFFAWSTRYIDVAIATIIYELWLIWFVLFWSKDTNSSERKVNIDYRSWIYLTIAIAGIFFVNISQKGTITKFANWGIFLALISSLLAAVQTLGPLKYGEITSEKHLRYKNCSNRCEKTKEIVSIFHTILIIAITLFVAATISVLIFILISESNFGTFNYDSKNFLGALIGGLAIGCFTFIFNRKGNIIAKNYPDINAIIYITPVLAIFWLLLARQIEINRPDMFIIGAALIIAINLFINFEVDNNRVGFEVLVISLWLTGVIVYFRDWFFNAAIEANWVWSYHEYYTLVALSATIFTLILSFRITRLENRTAKEEDLAISIYTDLKNTYLNSSLYLVEKIDATKSPEKLRLYRSELDKIISGSTISDNKKSSMIKKLNNLVLSKLRSREISEPTILYIFAAITVSLIIFSRPHISASTQEYVGFFVDFFSIIFSSAIIYMLANLRDLTRERNYSIFEFIFHLKHANSVHTSKGENASDKISNPAEQKSLSGMLVLLMLLIFGLLLWNKWLGSGWLVPFNIIPLK